MSPETAQSWVECGSGDQSLSTDCPDLGLIPDQYMWDLWWKKRHWERFLSQYFSFPLSISFHQCSILIFIHLSPTVYNLSN
jgi:hypothetical protein